MGVGERCRKRSTQPCHFWSRWGVCHLMQKAPPRKPAEILAWSSQWWRALNLSTQELWLGLCCAWCGVPCDAMTSKQCYRIVPSCQTMGCVSCLAKKEVSVHIWRTTSLSGEDWLRCGHELWSEDPFNFRRDYLVMGPNKSWNGVKRKFLAPSALSGAIAKLLGTLSVPCKAGAGWELMGAQHLLPDGLESVAGHSPRNFLTSVVAALGFSKDVEHGFGLFGGVRPHLPPSGLQDPKGGEQVLGVGLRCTVLRRRDDWTVM